MHREQRNFEKVLSGSCSKAELEQILEWGKSKQLEAELETMLGDNWPPMNQISGAADSEPLFEKNQAKIENLDNVSSKTYPPSKSVYRIPRVWKYAAVVVSLLLGVLLFTGETVLLVIFLMGWELKG